MATVSVVIPTYNRAALLRHAIDSALGQGHRNVEIVVVDDGSTDETPAVLRDYAGRVVHLRQPNRGVNAARNAAVANSHGEFIALLDSDDVYLPFALELLSGVLERFPTIGFAYGDFQILRAGCPPFGPGLLSWHGSGHRWNRAFNTHCRFRELGMKLPDGLVRDDFDVYTGDIYDASLLGPQVPTSASLIRRSLIGDLRFPEFDSLCGDWEFFARLSRRHGAAYVDIPVMLNRSHEDEVRLTRVDAASQLERRIELIDRLWRQDTAFLADHGVAVDARQFDLLLTLARNRLLAGDMFRARTALARAALIRSNQRLPQWLALRIGAYLPGAASLMRGARAIRDWSWRLLQGRRK